MHETVVYMTDPEARFVSLVKRGANRTPFRIVKQQKELDMKVIQRIVAKKGTDVAVIKSAVGEEAAGVLNLSEPKEAGAFVLYDQHPEDAFKADSLDVVSLSEDNSVICLCGELVEKSEGFVSKLLSRKQAVKGVEVPDELERMNATVLKAALADSLWPELDALGNGIHNILTQSEGKASDKVKMCRTLCDNFIASLEVAASAMKSDDFALVKPETAEPTTEQPEQAEPAEKTDAPEDKEPANPAEPTEQAEKSAEPEAPVESPEAKLMAALAAVEKASKEETAELKKTLDALLERVAKMEKAPATVVTSHEDSGKAGGQETTKKSEKSVFAGLFGDLHR